MARYTGKAQVWARQKNESADMMFWGYVKANFASRQPSEEILNGALLLTNQPPRLSNVDLTVCTKVAELQLAERTSGNYYLSATAEICTLLVCDAEGSSLLR